MSSSAQTGMRDGRALWIRAAILAGICLLALAVRVYIRYDYGYVFYGDATTGMPRSDATTFDIHALNLAEGRGFGDYIRQFRSQSYVPPGHPFFLGFFYFLLGNRPVWVGWAVAILGSLLPLFAYLWAREMFGRAVGYLAAIFTAFYLSFVRIGFSLMSEPTAILSMAVALWLAARLARRPSLSGGILAGLAFGFSALVRPSALAFMWTMLIPLAVVRSVSLRRRAVAGLVYLAAAAVLPAAWQVRNWIVHGEPAAIYSSISARHAWTGANPKYGPGFYSRESWHETLWRDPEASELRMIRRLQEETREFVRADRIRYLFGCFWRMHYLNIVETAPHTAEGQKIPVVPNDYGGWIFVQTTVLFVLALLGIARALRVRTVGVSVEGEACAIPGGAWSASVGLGLVLAAVGTGFYGATDRYRWPLEYTLIPFAALAVCSLARITTVDLMGPWRIEAGPAPEPGWLRTTRKAVALAGLATIAAYLAGLAFVRAHPDRSAEEARVVPAVELQQALEEARLAEEVAAQEPRRITYEMVLGEQRKNYGEVKDLNDKIVVWWGRVLYPSYFHDGRLKWSYIVLSPRAGDFGGARVGMASAKHARTGLYGIHHGDIITVLARIRYAKEPLGRPDLEVFAAVPGRLAEGD